MTLSWNTDGKGKATSYEVWLDDDRVMGLRGYGQTLAEAKADLLRKVQAFRVDLQSIDADTPCEQRAFGYY